MATHKSTSANGKNQLHFGIGFSIDQASYNQTLQALKKLQNITQDDITGKTYGSKSMQNQIDRIKQSASEVQKIWKQAFNSDLGVLNIQKFNSLLNSSGLNLKKLGKDWASTGAVGANALRNLASATLTANMNLKRTDSLVNKIGTTFLNTIKWTFASSVINSFTGSLQQSFGYIKSLDSSLNDIRIVTGKSADEMSKFAVKANDAAKALGKQTTDYTNAALIYYQQGLNEEESNTLAETTLKVSNITGQSASTVSEEITAVMNGYKLGANQVEAAFDSLAAVAATTASDLSEISTGMSKVASTANMLGVPLDSLNAQLATIVSVTRQAPESVGTALKTIYARLNDLKLGGTDEDGIQLGDVSGSLEKMGVHILDEQNNLRDLGTVINEVAASWSNWTDKQRIAMAEIMAGKRQYNNLIALFDNWDMYTKALNTSLNAQGTIAKQNGIYLDSLAAHMNSLKAAQEGVMDSFFDSDTFKGFIDFGTSALGVLERIIDALGGGGTILGSLAALAGRVFSNQISKEIANAVINLKNYNFNLQQIKSSMEALKNFKDIELTVKDNGTKKIIDLKEQIMSFGNLVTAEEHNQANAIIQKVNALYQERDAWIENYNTATDFLGIQEVDFIDADSFLGLDEAELQKQINNNIEKLNQFKTDYQKYIKDIAKYRSNDKNFDGSGFLNIEIPEDTIGDIVGALSRLKDETRLLQEQFNMSDKQAEEFFEKISNGANISKADLTKLIAIFKQGTGQINQSISTLKNSASFLGDNFEQKIKSAQAEWNNFINSLQTTQHVKQIVQLVSTTGQLAAGFQTLTNIVNIAGNESIDAGQRALQIVTNIGLALPQIISGIKGMGETFAGLGLIKTPTNELEDFSDKIDEIKELPNVLSGMEDIKFGDLGGIDLETQSYKEKLQDIANTLGIDKDALQDLGAEKARDIVITKAQEDATKSLTAAEKAKNAVMMAGPAIIFAIITVISSLIKAYQEAKKREAELAQKQVEHSKEVLTQKQEQKRKIDELATSYDKLYKQYKNHQISLAEMRKSSYDLCKEYGDYDLMVKALTGSYEELAEAMRKAQEIQNNGAIIAAEQTERDIINAGKKQAAAYNAEHMISSAGAKGGIGANFINMGDAVGALFNPQNLKDQAAKSQQLVKDIVKLTGAKATYKQDGLGATIDFSESWDAVADHWNEIQKLLADNAEELANNPMWNAINDYLTKMEGNIKTLQENRETKKQAGLENILLSDDTKAKRDAVKNQETFKTYYDSIVEQAKQFSKDEEQAREWASKKILEDEGLRKFSYVDKIKDSLGGQYEKVKNYIESLSEEDLALIVSGNIEFLGKQGPQALKQGLQILKSKVTPEDTELAMQIRAEIAKGGQIKDEDIKSLSIQSGVDASALEDSLDSGSVLDKLDRLKEVTDIIGKSTLEFLSKSKEEADEELDKITDKLEILQEKKHEIENAGGMPSDVKEKLIGDIDEEIAACQTLQEKLQQISNGLTPEQIDKGYFDYFKNEIDNLVTKTETLKSAAEMIGEGFKVAAEDVQQFASLYPELLDQATYTADGQMVLNQQVVQDFVDKKSEQIKADAEAKKAELNQQIAIYEARVKFDQAEMQSLQKYLQGEIDGTQLKQQLQQSYGEYTQDVAKVLGTTQEDLTKNGIINIDNLGTEVHEVLAGIAKQYSQINAYAQKAIAGKANGNLTISAAAKGNQTAQAFAASMNVSDVYQRNPQEYNQVFDSYKKIQQQYEADMDRLNGLRAALSGVESSTASSLAALGRVAAGQAGKASGKSGGGGSSKDPETREYKDYSDKAIEDERDIYLQINRIIENTQRTLEKLEKTTEKLVGSKMVAALQQQNKILAQQAVNYQKKADIAREEQDRLAKELSQYGFTFGDNGELNNYNTAYTANASRINAQIQAIQDEVNAAIAAYNTLDAAGQQAQKEQLEALEKSSEARVQALNKEWETITNGVSKYNEAMDTVYESQKAAAQANEKQYENMISLFEKKIKVTVDFNDAKREFNKFVKDIVNNFSKETAKGLSVLRDASIADLSTFLDGSNSDANTYLEGLTKAQSALERMQASGSTYDDETGFSQEKALEFGQQYSKGLMESLTNAKESVDELFDTWLEGWDRIEQQLDKQVKKYDFINDQLEHGKKLVTLLNGDKAYDQLDKYYDEQIKNDNSRLDMLKKQKQFIENSMKREQELLKQYPEGTRQYEQAMKRYETLQNSWMDNINELNSAIEDSVERLLEKYGNLWDKILTESKNSLTGGMDFDNASEEWQLVKKNADLYLDDINKGFETEKFNLAIEKALADTEGNVKAQKALNDLRDKELTKLKEKERITQYDVDRANALLALEQKRIALEEAQNNKSKLRLRRDSQGNYSYQYTADEEDVGDKRTDYLNAMQNVYNMDRQAYRNNLDMMQAATNEYYSKMSELREAYLRGDDTALERMRILNEQYQQYITSLARENTDIRTNLTQSAGESARQVYEDDEKYFGNMVDYEVGYLNSKLVPGWDDAIQKISDKVNGEGGFIKTTQGLTQGLTDLTNEYKKKLDETAEAAGRDLGVIDEGLDQIDEDTAGILSKVEQWITDNGNLITTLQNEKTELDKIIDSANTYVDVLGRMSAAAADAISRWQALQGQINQAIRVAQLARQEAAKPVVSAPSYVGAVSSPGEADANPNSGGGGGGGYGGGSPSYSSPAPEPEPPSPDTVDIVGESGYDLGVYINGAYSHSVSYADLVDLSHVPSVSGAAYDSYVAKEIEDAKRMKKDYLRNQYQSWGYEVLFNTGGYTGQWANGDRDGRLAVLHQKELVLNADDTKNILSAVDIVRTMRDALNFITSDSSLPNFAKNLASTSSSSQLEQNVHITATFPNVVNSNEIQIALENLTSKASQYINRR